MSVPGEAVVSYDALTATLTVLFGSASHLDPAEITDDLFLFFDASARGRVVKLQALAPEDPSPAWRTAVVDVLGPTVGRHCVHLMDAERDVVASPLALPLREWAVLNEVQWPGLHDAWRTAYGLPRLPADRPAGAVAAIDGLLAASDRRPERLAAGALHTRLSVPPPLAAIGAIHPVVDVRLEGAVARIEAMPRPGAPDPVLDALVLCPEPRSPAPVPLARANGMLAAEIPLRHPVNVDHPRRCLLHLAVRPMPGSAESRFPFVFTWVEPNGQVGQSLGNRTEARAGASFAGAAAGRLGNRINWGTGKRQTKVEVVHEGDGLWATGVLAAERRAGRVRVRCALTADARAALAVVVPEGRWDVDAGRLDAVGPVRADGYFQVRLATVTGAPFDGELVSALDLELELK